ncbi:tubby [Pancytospora philotis]|nr:tubby [Pancytospora philotis]
MRPMRDEEMADAMALDTERRERAADRPVALTIDEAEEIEHAVIVDEAQDDAPIDRFRQILRDGLRSEDLEELQPNRFVGAPALGQTVDSCLNDVVNAKLPLGMISRGTVIIESVLFNNTYVYKHSDGTKMLHSRRTLYGFNIYSSLENDKLIAQLRANIFGTRYSLDGSLCIKYETTFLQRSSPRTFVVKLDNLELCNKKPYFNHDTMSYSLNFNGRITQPSVRNMQIIHPLDPNYITLTFGKERDDAYILDFSHPWTPLNAFCVALSAMDHKFGCN